KPPLGVAVRRLTHTANDPDGKLRGVAGHIRACNDGRSIVFVGRVRQAKKIVSQLFLVSPQTRIIKQLSSIPGGIVGDPRYSPDGAFVAAAMPDGSVGVFSALS